ncbi:hypothetical protein FQN54_000684 [Arachnomyces sp. PD_36]|nr:hypothetical protein FQN54_000684 [Arachnomyces sp. PD_36]
MAFFPRFPSSEFGPLFRLLDDYDVHRSGQKPSNLQHVPSFSPRFDVRELKDGYHLDGELPGINQQDVDIEFTDPHTLVIKGRSERQYTNTNLDETPETHTPAESQPGSPKSLQPTVEEEGDGNQAKAKETAVATTTASKQVSKPAAEKKHKFWVSERSVGQFHRTFSFPTRVDQDNVQASLKNGILSIIVPKAAPPTARKIAIN